VTKTIHALARLTALSLALLAAAAIADQEMLMKGNDTVAAPGVEWTAAKSIPPGAQMVLLYGSPDKPGPYIFRVKFPAGYKLPPHHHQDARAVTVLQGDYWSAVGDTFDQSKLKKFGPRDYYTTDAGVNHFAWAETEVIIQEMGMGPVPSPVEYVNPADDPRK
jgi:quercetin dioxygenase-like cupin family protein